MERKLQMTKDGSYTLYLPEWDECFHSHNGAVQESQHIFIQLGLSFLASQNSSIRILEMGYGSGLNALLTHDYAQRKGLQIHYTGLELYPIVEEEFVSLKHAIHVEGSVDVSRRVFDCPWEEISEVDSFFDLEKRKIDMLDFEAIPNSYDLIYMDAFDPELQPELWSIPQFEKMYLALTTGGVLTTYSVKGWVKRNIKAAGFKIEKHPGPPGKREVLRAIKA